MELLGVDVKIILLAIVSVINFILGTLIYLSSGRKSSRFFVITIFFVVVWSIGINLYIQPGLNSLTYLWSTVNYLAAGFIAFFFFYFCYYFDSESRALNNKFKWLSVISLVIIIVFILMSGSKMAVIAGLEEVNGAKIESFGLSYPFYVLFISLYFLGGLTMLIHKYRKGIGPIRDQLRYIILGTGISIVFGITTNIILPNIDIYSFDWLGPTGTFIMIAFISYAITKHRLWNFRIVAIELFIGLMILTLVLQIFVAESFAERSIKAAIFVIVIVFSYYLIRGMLRAIDAREKRMELADSLSRANKKLREVDIEKSDFVSITSHQFRTPLTIIKGYASMLLEGSFGSVGNARQKNILEQVLRASERLVLTIEEFLNISRIDKREMEYNFKEMDLRQLLGDTIKYFESTIKESKLDFKFKTDGHDLYTVEADKEKIKEVLSNIIDNAIKYTPAGGSVSVLLSKLDNLGIYRIEFSDTGIGIQKGMMSRLFEKFSRAEGSTKLHTEGRGLGLYVAKQVMSAHGGRIWAESSGKDQGSIFYMEFADPKTRNKRKEIKSFIEEI